jgi:hypothetical protein
VFKQIPGSLKRNTPPVGKAVENNWSSSRLTTLVVFNLGEAMITGDSRCIQISAHRDISLKEPRNIAGLD